MKQGHNATQAVGGTAIQLASEMGTRRIGHVQVCSIYILRSLRDPQKPYDSLQRTPKWEMLVQQL